MQIKFLKNVNILLFFPLPNTSKTHNFCNILPPSPQQTSSFRRLGSHPFGFTWHLNHLAKEQDTQGGACLLIYSCDVFVGFPDGTVVKTPLANTGDMGLIPGLGRSPGGEHGNPLQYFCLGNHMDRHSYSS